MLQGSFRRQVKLAIPAYVILVVLIIIASFGSEYFRTLSNFNRIMSQVAPLAIVALGQSVLMLSGGIDLSVGNVFALVSCIVATYNTTIGLFPAILISLIVSLILGLINGLGVTKLGIPPMIMTLSTMSIAKGLSLIVRPNAGGSIPEGMYDFFNFTAGPISTSLILILLFAAITFLLIHCTRFGRNIYCVGCDEISARRNGVSVTFIKIAAYMICALLAGLAGILMTARMSSGDALIGESYGLDSITAVVVGGTAMEGGKGGILGTIGGAMLVSMISNFLNMLGINPMTQYLVKGIILIIALAIRVNRDR